MPACEGVVASRFLLRLRYGNVPEGGLALIPVPASVTQLLNTLEAFYGVQEPRGPIDPYEFIVWWHCGYPQSEERCARGWEALRSHVGVQPSEILKAGEARLITALKAGGMVPELRAVRVQEIARRVLQEFDGDLRRALAGPIQNARKVLKGFHGIGDPGADRILLFARISPVAAVPSNCPHVLVRIVHGVERENYGAIYRGAEEIIAAEVSRDFPSRQRAYLLLKRHGQEICKSKPQCDRCPVRAACAYAAV
jgi:endonuclease III